MIFKGDRVSLIKRPPQEIPANTADAQRRQAQAIFRRTGLPTLIIARPGTYGSSGNHYRRRQVEEFRALNAAVDAIKARYAIQRFILSGHSGGATAASALLTFGRRDIDCAVLTSGAWGLLERAERMRKEEDRKAADHKNAQRELVGALFADALGDQHGKRHAEHRNAQQQAGLVINF